MSEFKYITRVTPRIEGKSLGLGKPVYMADLFHRLFMEFYR